MNSFTQFLSVRIVLSCFYLLIFYLEKFSTWIWRLPYTWSLNPLLSTTFTAKSDGQRWPCNTFSRHFFWRLSFSNWRRWFLCSWKTLPYPLKDLILQYHAVSFRVVNERIDEITEDGLSVKTVKMNVHLSDGRELWVSSPFWLFACRLPFACKLSA